MKKTPGRLLILNLLFVLLVLLFLTRDGISTLFESKNNQPLAKVQPEAIKEIEIKNGGIITHLIKKNNKWLIKKDNIEFLADQQRIESIIYNLLNFQKESLISTNKKRHGDFGIGPKKIVLKTSTDWYTVFVGTSQNLDIGYIRIGEENELYALSGSDQMFNPPDYRDLYIHVISSEQNVSQFNIKYNGTQLSFEKKDNNWMVNGKKAKHELVDYYINAFTTLKSIDILLPEQLQDLFKKATPIISIQAKEKGKTIQAEIVSIIDKENKPMYYLKSDTISSVYQLDETTVEELKKTEKDFIE
jgi:hypothetical protein